MRDIPWLQLQAIGKELADFLYAGDLPRDRTTIMQGGYGIARYTRRYLRAYRPGQIINGAYQYGAIGPDVGYAVGVAAAVRDGVGPQVVHRIGRCAEHGLVFNHSRHSGSW